MAAADEVLAAVGMAAAPFAPLRVVHCDIHRIGVGSGGWFIMCIEHSMSPRRPGERDPRSSAPGS
jgi:hypothetical protein